jgi:hypothetical protein
MESMLTNEHLASLRDWLLPMLMNGQVTIVKAEKAVYNLEGTMGVTAEPVENYKEKNRNS